MTPSGWRWNPRVALTAVVVFLLTQLTIPVVQLSQEHDRAQRFGWQMFAYSTSGLYIAHTEQGEREIDLDEILARPRADIDLDQIVPAHVCRTRDDVIRVTWDGGALEC